MLKQDSGAHTGQDTGTKGGQVVGRQAGNYSNLVNTCYLHPNPSNGHFSARLQYPVTDAGIYVTDIRGAILVTTKLNGTEADFDISKYAPGLYILHLKSGNYEFDAKVVKEW